MAPYENFEQWNPKPDIFENSIQKVAVGKTYHFQLLLNFNSWKDLFAILYASCFPLVFYFKIPSSCAFLVYELLRYVCKWHLLNILVYLFFTYIGIGRYLKKNICVLQILDIISILHSRWCCHWRLVNRWFWYNFHIIL